MLHKALIIGPNLGMGGVERASANYANLLAENGWAVTYLELIPKKQFFSLHPEVRFLEGPVFNKGQINTLKTLRYIRKTVMNEKPIVILGFTKLYAALANLSVLFSSFQVIVLERSSPLYIWPRQVEWFARVSFFFKKCGGIIAQTSMAAKYQQRYYRTQHVLALPNPVRPIQTPIKISKEKWILLVGRLRDDCKGFDRFMQVLDKMEFPDEEWKVVFAGGEVGEAGYLLQLLQQPEKKEKMIFLGKVDKLDELYAKAAVFVIPSRSEGFPNALCEAMAAGLPAVSFDFVAGPRDLIEDGENGYIIEDGNVTEMAKTIQFLMNEPAERERVGKQAAEIADRLSYDQTSRKLIKFLQNLKKT